MQSPASKPENASLPVPSDAPESGAVSAASGLSAPAESSPTAEHCAASLASGLSDAAGKAIVAGPDWAKELNCSITVCDADGVIVYMNDAAVRQYERRGNLIGKNLFDCHGERAAAIIRALLRSGGTNSYTIEKGGIHKMIFQSAWKKDGVVCGLCEISMVIPDPLPHHVRG